MREGVAEFCLGTVQLGMRYGVNNQLGHQPSEEEAWSVLQTALEHGIRAFDTANIYGTAEQILGNFRLGEKGGKLYSKLKPGCQNRPEAVLDEVRGSMERLGVPALEGYMLHDAADMNRSGIMEGLLTAKERGWARKLGVSIYEPEDALQAAAEERFDFIQVPYHVLDQRLDEAGFFTLAHRNGKEVYARSAFLQGLLLMEPEKAEAAVPGAGRFVRQFQDLARQAGFLPWEAAMLYSLLHPGIDYVVFGVDTPEQLCQNLAVAEKAASFRACWNALRGVFSGIPREIIVPSLWKKVGQ